MVFNQTRGERGSLYVIAQFYTSGNSGEQCDVSVPTLPGLETFANSLVVSVSVKILVSSHIAREASQ